MGGGIGVRNFKYAGREMKGVVGRPVCKMQVFIFIFLLRGSSGWAFKRKRGRVFFSLQGVWVFFFVWRGEGLVFLEGEERAFILFV